MRRVLSTNTDKEVEWDKILPPDELQTWKNWLECLNDLHRLSVPRCISLTAGDLEKKTMHIFSDASEDAIGNVSYFRNVSTTGKVELSFVRGESKVSPRAATTIPRLELCAAAEAVLSARRIISQLKTPPAEVYFYSDSKVVLAYLRNESKRFTRYIQRRIDIVLQGSELSSWKFVNTSQNPADHATRPKTPEQLLQTNWFRGPEFLYTQELPSGTDQTPVFQVESLPEEIEAVKSGVLYASTRVNFLQTLFEKFSSWKLIVKITTRVVFFAFKLLGKVRTRTQGSNTQVIDMNSAAQRAHRVLIKEAQDLHYGNLSKREFSMSPQHRLASVETPMV